MDAFEKLAGVANLGEEELARVRRIVLTRADTRAEADALFNTPSKWRKEERDYVNSLFVQGKGAETMAPILQKEACKNVDAWFEKNAGIFLTDAQRRFPELTKVAHLRKAANAGPTISKRTVTPAKGTAPVKSSLSGGAA